MHARFPRARRARPARKLVHASEHDLQVAVLTYLNITARPDVYVFSIPNSGLRSRRIGARMKLEGLSPGVADLCILLPFGKCAWLEMKTAVGKQSPAQKGFEAICRRLGHTYAVAHSFEEAVTFLRQIGALR